MKVAVIGAGLFGSIIAAALREQGRSVTIIDDDRPTAGSKPAACLMKPSWFSGLGKDVTEPALSLIDRLYGIKDVAFELGLGTRGVVHWVRPSDILRGSDVQANVRAVVPWERAWKVCFASDRGIMKVPLFFDKVVVATGVWAEDLLPELRGRVTRQAGVAFLWPNRELTTPVIRPWAPYKQLVAFNRGDGLWASDGTAIKEENWSEERQADAWGRCHRLVGNYVPWSAEVPEPRTLFGLRPYAKERPCLLEETRPGLWTATGGAKNGTIAAGWCASEITRRMQ